MISPPPPYEFEPIAPTRSDLPLRLLQRMRASAWGQLLLPVYYGSLGPISWAYLKGWISSDQWRWLNDHLLWPIEDVMQQTQGQLGPLLWAWQLWWER